MKALKAKLERLQRKVRRRQAIRERLRNFIAYAKKHSLKGLAQQTEKVVDRLTEKLKELHREVRLVEKDLENREQRLGGRRDKFMDWVRAQIGKDENDAEVDGWVRTLMGYGSSDSIPWCSIFAGTGLKRVGIPLPSSVAYSGAWLTWSHGHRVSYSDVQEGDLLIFDWGDGGITDHVAVYDKSGYCIGGNQRDTDTGGQVSRVPVTTSALVGVVRPNWKED
jgi:hypothetical protein